MQTLYSIFDNDGYISHAEFHDECPANGTELLVCNFVKPRLVNGVITEAASEPEIAEDKLKRINDIKNDYSRRIAVIMNPHQNNLIYLQIPIPQDILDQVDVLREECNDKIDAIDSAENFR